MDGYAQGQKLAAAGRFAEAISAFETALAARPGDTRILFALGNTARALGLAPAAEHFYRTVLALEPERLEAVVNLANLKRAEGDFAGAAAVVRPALARRPTDADLRLTLGSILRECGDRNGAIAEYRAALAARPDFVPALVNLADLTADNGDDDSALALYDRALQRDPDNTQGRFNRAILHLGRGRLEQGWRDYAARRGIAGKVPQPDHGLPRWQGESLHGRRLLVTSEQGIGDQVMFASLIPELAGRTTSEGGALLLECEPRLRPLFSRSFAGVATRDWTIEKRDGVLLAHYDWLAAAGGADCFIELGSLPALLRPSLAAFPVPHVYLKPDSAEVARWRQVLAPLPRPWIGFSWRSGAIGGGRKVQYAEPAHWAAFLRHLPGSAIAAQYGAGADEIAGFTAASGRPVFLPPNLDQKNELDRTVAMLSVLDAVVTAPTAVSWLAAAAGVPTFKIFGEASWAWTAFGQAYEPFTPAARCLIAAVPGDWPQVLQQALKALAV